VLKAIRGMKYYEILALNLEVYVSVCNLLSSPSIDGTVGKFDAI
jgi:hypothetical protein